MLVAEDDEVLAKVVAVGLRREGMAVDIALDGDDALAHLGVNDYDVVVLDRDLPGTHGDDVCQTLVAERSAVRVRMLTAASTVTALVLSTSLWATPALAAPSGMRAEVIAVFESLSLGKMPLAATVKGFDRFPPRQLPAAGKRRSACYRLDDDPCRLGVRPEVPVMGRTFLSAPAGRPASERRLRAPRLTSGLTA